MIQLDQGDRVHHQVAVIGDEHERYRLGVLSVYVGQRQLYEPRHAGAENAEAILARQHVHERRVGEVDQHHVAKKAIGGEDVEEVLAGRVERRIGDDEVDVEIDVSEVQETAARKLLIDAVDKALVAAIRTAVIVDHAEIALVDVLGGEEEAVIVGPHRALDLAEIARDIDKAAVAVGSRRARVSGPGVDLVAPGERGAPAIVVERAREVVRVGGAVARSEEHTYELQSL